MTDSPISLLQSAAALYYPHIEVDQNWLKAALLYCDSVRRIIPREAEWEIHDNPEIEVAIDSERLVNTSPTEYRDAASERFIQQFLPFLDGGILSEGSGQRRPRLDRERIVDWFHMGILDSPRHRHYIHPEKIANNLRYELSQRGLIAEVGNWYRVSELIATLYMTCLGGVMSEGMCLPLVTDSKAIAIAGEYVLYGEAPSVDELGENRGVLLNLGFQFPEPRALASVPMKTIVDFNRRTVSDREHLRTTVDEVIRESQQITDANALNDYWRHKRELVADAVKQHRRRLDEIKVSVGITSLLTIRAPMLIKAVPHTEWIDPYALGATGIGIALIDWWARLRGKVEEQRTKSPWHYALHVEETFGHE